jgi:hypothetical protein
MSAAEPIGAIADKIVASFDRVVTCRDCAKPIEGEAIARPRFGVDVNPNCEKVFFHPTCWEERERVRIQGERRMQEERLAGTLKRIEGGFHCALAGSTTAYGERLLNTPSWKWARFDNAEFRRRVRPKILAAGENWSPDAGSLLLSAPTGAGKTAVWVAWLWRELDRALARAKAEPHVEHGHGVRRFAFVSAAELVVARRNSKLGAEAELIELAKDTGILFLDECTTEPLSEVLFEVIDHRYRQQHATVCTTGLRVAEFRARYGDASYRRLCEGGAVVEGWSK